MREDSLLSPLNLKGAASDEASRRAGTWAYYTLRFPVLGTLSAMFFGLILGSYAAFFATERFGVPFGDAQHWRIAGGVLGALLAGWLVFKFERFMARKHAEQLAQHHRDKARIREAEHARKMAEAKASGALDRWTS